MYVMIKDKSEVYNAIQRLKKNNYGNTIELLKVAGYLLTQFVRKKNKDYRSSGL